MIWIEPLKTRTASILVAKGRSREAAALVKNKDGIDIILVSRYRVEKRFKLWSGRGAFSMSLFYNVTIVIAI